MPGYCRMAVLAVDKEVVGKHFGSKVDSAVDTVEHKIAELV